MPAITFDQLKKKSLEYNKFINAVAIHVATDCSGPWVSQNNKAFVAKWLLKNSRGIKAVEDAWDKEADKKNALPADGSFPPPAFIKSVGKAVSDLCPLSEFYDWVSKEFPKSISGYLSSSVTITTPMVTEAMSKNGKALKDSIDEAIDKCIEGARDKFSLTQELKILLSSPKNAFYVILKEKSEKTSAAEKERDVAADYEENHAESAALQKIQDAEDKKRRAEIKKQLLAIARRLVMFAETALEGWQAFNDLNNDQWFVSFFMPDLPDKPDTVVAYAKSLYNRINSDNYKNLEPIMKSVEKRVTEALQSISNYRASIEDRSAKIITGLELTRDISFTIVETYLTAGTGTGATIAIGAAAAALKKGAEEAGKGIAGTSGGAVDALLNVGKEAAIASVLGYVFRDGGKTKKFFGEITQKGAPYIAKGPLAKAGPERISKFVTEWALANLQDAFKMALDLAVGGKMSADDFKQKLCDNLWQKIPISMFFKGIDDHFAEKSWAAFKKRPAFKNLDESVLKVIEDAYKEMLPTYSTKILDTALPPLMDTAKNALLSKNELSDQFVLLAMKDMAFVREVEKLANRS